MPTNNRFGFGVPPRTGLLDPNVGSFAESLCVAGYPKKSLSNRQRIAAEFVRWAKRKKLSVIHCDETHVAAFLGRSPRRSKHRVPLERTAVRLFLRHIRAEAGIPDPPLRMDSSPTDGLERGYVDYLRKERGLAENSILVYSPYIHDFLTELVAKTGSVSLRRLNARTVQDFLLDRIRGRSSEWSRLLATALRSFLRFLFVRGEMTIDISPSVPMFRRWRQAEVPTFLSPEDVGRVLSATDRSTPRGRRDYAILLLLARLGLRA
jgi:integrase